MEKLLRAMGMEIDDEVNKIIQAYKEVYLDEFDEESFKFFVEHEIKDAKSYMREKAWEDVLDGNESFPDNELYMEILEEVAEEHEKMARRFMKRNFAERDENDDDDNEFPVSSGMEAYGEFGAFAGGDGFGDFSGRLNFDENFFGIEEEFANENEGNFFLDGLQILDSYDPDEQF